MYGFIHSFNSFLWSLHFHQSLSAWSAVDTVWCYNVANCIPQCESALYKTLMFDAQCFYVQFKLIIFAIL